MSKIDLTPAKLADIKKKAEGCDPKYWVMDQHGDVMAVDFDSKGTQPKIARVEFLEDAEHIAAADPATVLALVEEIERLRAAQCWIVVELNGELAAGPFFTKCDAENFRMAKLCDDEEYSTYKVQVWNGKESEAGQ